MAAPLDFPVVTRPSPHDANVLIYEIVDIAKHGFGREDYPLIAYGAMHPNQRDFAGFRLCKEEVVDDTHIRRWYATEFVCEDIYNFSIKYDGESASHPIVPRRYITRRDSAPPNVAAGTRLSAFTGVWNIKVTNGGTLYSLTPTVTIAAPGAGTTATARAVLGENGTIAWIVVTGEGSGYAAAPVVTIGASDGGGVLATATAVIQSATNVLVAESVNELPADDPRASIFVAWDKIYETLPGPQIPFTRYDDDLGPVQGYRRAVANTGQVSSGTPTTKTNYQSRDGSSVVLWEIVETSTNGTGAPGAGTNPAFPWEFSDFYEEVRGAVQRAAQLKIADGTEVGSVSIIANGVSGVAITGAGTGYADVFAVTFTGAGSGAAGVAYAASGVIKAIHVTRPGSGYSAGATPVLSAGGGSGGTATATTAASMVVELKYEAVDEFKVRGIAETYVIPGPTIQTIEIEPESGILLTVSRTLKEKTAITEGSVLSGASDSVRTLTTTELGRTGIADVLGIEVSTLYPASAFYSSTTAVIEEQDRPFQYPGRLNFNNRDPGGTDVLYPIGDVTTGTLYGIAASTGMHPAFPQAQLTKHTIRTWFINVLDSAAPTVSFDEIRPKSITFTDGTDTASFSNVLFDTFTLYFPVFGGDVTMPATSPDFTTYFTTWIGASKIVDGKVDKLRPNRYKVQTVSVVMR